MDVPTEGVHDAILSYFQSQLNTLIASLSDQVLSAHSQTLDHLQVYASAMEELKAAASRAAQLHQQLNAAMSSLSRELSHVDLYDHQLTLVETMVKELEQSVAEV